ncbi:MAG: sulfatase-like hydrolase/transferase [Acidimicrobiia bacterium]|nr:sulfatase-like hydrolase/transferase [Acidimicrobiia bacterium]
MTAVLRMMGVLVATVLVSALVTATPVEAQTEPNIVLINLDDADYSMFEDPALEAFFPNIKTHLRDAGLRLSNLHVTTPLCGPSRASLLRSQQAHNTGVLVNTPTAEWTGGFGESYENGYTSDELASWLQTAGYTTMLVGKYLHEQYPAASGDNRFEPPHWDEFYATLGGKYYEYVQQINGTRTPRSAPYPADFRTDRERDQAQQLIQTAAPGPDPFFLYLAPYAPHTSVTPMYAARHAGLFDGLSVPRTPDFNEADMSDKPAHIQQLPVLNASALAYLDGLYRDRLRSMMAVDEMIGALVAELSAAGELDDTYIMLTSDNGFSLGHNRLEAKKLPYDRMTRVGMLVRGPGIPAGVDANHLLGHTDIAPTLLELAKGSTPDWSDGNSFASVLFDPANTPLDGIRDSVVIENWADKNQRGQTIEGRYTAVRQVDSVYVDWDNGEREYYDLAADPLQLDNSYDSLPAADRYWLAVLTKIYWGTCAGADCTRRTSSLQPPETTVTAPPPTGDISFPVTVTGTATDDTGVAAVDLVIRPRDEDLYWDGDSFEAAFATVAADLTAPGTPSSPFQAQLWLPNRDVDIFARTRDVVGITDPTAVLIRLDGVVDTTDPDTTLTGPPNGAQITGPVTVSGDASDDVGVDEVLLTIRDTSTGEYWNGTAMQPGYSRVAATLADPGRPTTGFDETESLPAGTYSITARAYDSAGNYDASIPIVNVTVTDQPVVVPGNAAGPEGDTGTSILDVPVTLDRPSTQTITVSYRTYPWEGPGLATAGVDYVATTGQVEFAPGQTQQTVPIEIIGDTTPEPNELGVEFALVQFFDPINATVDPSFFGFGVAIITEDDV